jgi:hypothetical protein
VKRLPKPNHLYILQDNDKEEKVTKFWRIYLYVMIVVLAFTLGWNIGMMT